MPGTRISFIPNKLTSLAQRKITAFLGLFPDTTTVSVRSLTWTSDQYQVFFLMLEAFLLLLPSMADLLLLPMIGTVHSASWQEQSVYSFQSLGKEKSESLAEGLILLVTQLFNVTHHIFLPRIFHPLPYRSWV